MSRTSRTAIVAGFLLIAISPTRASDPASPVSATREPLISNARQLTFEGRRAGEGYFNREGTKMIFQSEREPGNPFFQIYIMDLSTGDTHRVSPGAGKTTCAWFHPSGERVLFASTHEDPEAEAKQKEELDWRAGGGGRRYTWDYDEHYDIYSADPDGSDLKNLTRTLGYDAEGSWSPDGKLIVFSSNRTAYSEELSPEERERFDQDASYLMDIYVMDADGSNVRRLTDKPGYDGGPFFSPDGRRICWRYFSKDGRIAEVWTMNIDGSDKKQLTDLGATSWAPFYHPSGEYLIFTTNIHGFTNFELYLVDVQGEKEPVRASDIQGFDGLPVFTPDGKHLCWTSNRTRNKQGQIFLADWDHAEAMRRLEQAPRRAAPEPSDTEAARSLPATGSDISATDLRNHVDQMVSNLPTTAAGNTGSMQAIIEYIAATFGRLGLEPAGQNATLFQFCEFPLLKGEKDHGTREVGCNVLARLRAADEPAAKALVIGAHVGPTEGVVDLRNHVSGVAGLLEIAEYLAAEKESGRLKPQRDILFAAFVGEPISAGFVMEDLDAAMKPKAGSQRAIAAYLGIEEIGRLADSAVLCGTETSEVWHGEIERRNVPVGLRLRMEAIPAPESAGFQFYGVGVPALSVSDGASSARPDEDLNESDAERLTRLTALIARSLATRTEIPGFTPIKPREAEAGSPYLGTEPDYAGGGHGVKLKGVIAGGPAEKAGLRAGDVIVKLDGSDIADIQAYAAALDQLKVGKEVVIVVERDGKPVTIRVTVGARE